MFGTEGARPSPRRQRGSAVITALLIVALAATVISGLFLRENVTVRSVENRLALSQTRWIERAAIDWAKVILRADARGGVVDHLGEPWAVPVADTSLDETVTAGSSLGKSSRTAMLAGQMIDAQGRFNLASLVQGGQASKPHLAAFQKLLTIVELPPSLADQVAARIVRSQPGSVDGRKVPATELPLVRLQDLVTVPGFDPARVEALAPFAIVLPRATPVNLNTAPPEVLAAVIPTLDVAAARRLAARRERSYFRDLNDASSQIDGQPVLPPTLLSVGSNFFLLRGMVRFDRVEASSETLLERSSDRVDIVWQQRF